MITKLLLPKIASRTTSRRFLHDSSSSAAVRAAATTAATTATTSTAPQPQWSGSLSYASPEADFTALHVSANPAGTVEAEWSQELSFASPESDFTAAYIPKSISSSSSSSDDLVKVDHLDLQVSANSATVESEWVQNILLKDAQQDVTQLQTVLEQQSEQPLDENVVNQMLHQLQLSSPESAIGYTHVAETMSESTKQDFRTILRDKGLPTTLPEEDVIPPALVDQTEMDRMMQHLHLNSPESALGVVHVAEVLDSTQKSQLQSHYEIQGKQVPNPLSQHDTINTDMNAGMDDLLLQQMLLVSSPESATGYSHVGETLTDPLKMELTNVTTPLPTSLEEALHATANERRAIVVTTATSPFRVVHVNAEWEGLCGYTQAEAKNKPIGDLLKGPETNTSRTMIQHLKTHPETLQAAVLVNYTKEGRKFYNRLQVGPLYNNNNDNNNNDNNTDKQNVVVEYLVGVLQEVKEDDQGMMMMTQQMAA